MNNSLATNATTAPAAAAPAWWRVISVWEVRLDHTRLEVRYLDDAYALRQADVDADGQGEVTGKGMTGLDGVCGDLKDGCGSVWVDADYTMPPWLEDLDWDSSSADGLGLRNRNDSNNNNNNGIGSIVVSPSREALSAPHATCAAPRPSSTTRLPASTPPTPTSASQPHHSRSPLALSYLATFFKLYTLFTLTCLVTLILAAYTEFFLLTQRIARLERASASLTLSLAAIGNDALETIRVRDADGLPLAACEPRLHELAASASALRRRLDRKQRKLRSARRRLRGVQVAVRAQFWRRVGWRRMVRLVRAVLGM